MKKQNQQRKVVWSFENVANWLNKNGWHSLVNVFKDYNIQYDRFLNLSEENIEDMLKNMNISLAEKRRLILSINKLKAEDQANRIPRIAIPSFHNNSILSSSPTTTTTTTATKKIDISQFIPVRTSSSDKNVSKMLENFHPTILTIPNTPRNTLKSPRINAQDPDIINKLMGKRLPVRIQVTLDADTFIRLWINNPIHPLDIKRSILSKLSIEADPAYFLFYHENGPKSTIPLSDDELLVTCQLSTDNRTNRILVVPLDGYNLIRQQFYQQQTQSYIVRYALTQSSPTPSPISTSSITGGIQLTDPETPNEEDALVEMKPSLSSSDLWATYPRDNNNRRPSASSSPWSNHSSFYGKSDTYIEGVSLFDPPSSTYKQHPPSPTVSTRSSSMSGDEISSVEEEDMIGERPTVEKLYRDIDKYLPGHDLDKEITVKRQISTVNRALGHRPSVRVVAKEAHRRWRQATNNVKLVNNLLRRKSTKMWGQSVERVKPGEESRIILPDTMTPTKMQWMKGNLIGRGSFGRVYHALNIATGDWVAVKEVDTALTVADARNEHLKEASDALYREISLLKDLDHENIVQYIGYDSNEEEGLIYIFLEYVPGGSISSLLNQYQFFDEALTKFFTRQILKGLAYLHERHILHRDIKGGNVLIDQNGVCKITDFGLSKCQTENNTSNNSQMKGTLYWMAPEVLTNNYSAKVDVWSLGCTVLEMITGEHPWMKLTTLAALYQIGLHNAPAIPENISDEAKDFLQLCLKIKPEERPTADELLSHPFVQIDPDFNFKECLKNQQPKDTTTNTTTYN